MELLDIDQLDILLQNNQMYQKQLKEMPIHNKIIEEYKLSKPFSGYKIAIAHVLVPNTLPMIISVIYGGGNITVTNCCPPTLDTAVVDFLFEIGCEIDLSLKKAKEFDYVIDCGGFFAESPPKLGIIEVTRSGIHRYNKILSTGDLNQISLISADDSKAKLIETFLGNPISVLEGIKKFVNPDIENYLRNRKVVIMGYGKIGRGLARLFRQYSQVLVMDVNSEVLSSANKRNFSTFQITSDVKKNTSAIMDYDIMLSATGFPNVISSSFIKSELNFDLMLNIGAVDEFGDDYDHSEVFMSKDRPFNFNLNPPTGNLYIDPILAAHVDGLRYIIENPVKTGPSKLPKVVDQRILKLFTEYHQIDISDIDLYFER